MKKGRTEIDIRVTLPDEDTEISDYYRFGVAMRSFLWWLEFRSAGIGKVGRYEHRNGEIVTWAATRQPGETDEQQAD